MNTILADAIELEADSIQISENGSLAWKLLIIDDDEEIHDVTRYALADYEFEEKSLEIASAYSAKEGRNLLGEKSDISVILLDVVMETPDAGLRLVEHIRGELKNEFVRIILRTGQPGEAPEYEVIRAFDINDYKSKTELTNVKLLTAITSALRSYSDIIQLDHYRKNLEHLVQERTAQLKAQNEQLTTLNHEKNEFLGIAAHDLKNPLSGIRNLAEMLLFNPDDLDALQKKEFLTQIVASSERMFELITNLLDINAIEQNGISLHLITLDIVPMAKMIGEIWKHRAEQKNITLTVETPQSSLVKADEIALQQVMENIISNAVKYSPQGKTVQVSIKEQNESVQFSVKDEGPGLSEGDKTKLFGKFARLSARPTGGEHSTGLGLSIVKRMVEAMNGRVWCESELGKGAAFIVELPKST